MIDPPQPSVTIIVLVLTGRQGAKCREILIEVYLGRGRSGWMTASASPFFPLKVSLRAASLGDRSSGSTAMCLTK
ncbi:hypothetical protein AWC03_12800 [Mycobacterium europaeum]|nr:hypothetical protein AWC03_12800 [Mycobacterium europaeum]